MNPLKILRNILPPLILISTLFAIYLRTLAPGLTWANDGSDGGDLISAAATGGVAHPAGYPLYLIFARLFQFLPIGSLAFRTNLMSALAMALAAALVYVLVRDLSSNHKKTGYWPAALAAGYAFGLAPLVWSQAVITEVYGLQVLLVALLLYLYAGPAQNSAATRSACFAWKRLDYWRGLTLGLAMGNHVTTVLLVPVAVVLGSIHRQAQPDGIPDTGYSWLKGLKLDRGAFLRQLGMFGAGLSIYLLIPLRALADPPVNWGNAITLARFWWLVSGQLYQSYYMQFSLVEFWVRVQAWASLLLQQWGLLGLILALIGLVYFFSPSRLFVFTIWQVIIYSGFAIIYGSFDSYVYLLPVCISFSIWIGLGLAGMMTSEVLRSPGPGLAISLLFLIYLFGSAAYHWPQVNASHDMRAENFGRQILESAPSNAIIFAEGDQAVFTTWYFHYALHERPDLVVIATDLLHFDWYQENLHSNYPSLVVPGPFPWPETIIIANTSRSVCYVQYADHAEIHC